MSTLLNKFQKFNQRYDLIKIQIEESRYELNDLPTTDYVGNPNDIEDILFKSDFDNFQSEPTGDIKYEIYEKNKDKLIKKDLTAHDVQVFINNL